MRRFFAYNNTSRQVYYLGIGDWVPHSNQSLHSHKDCHELVIMAIVTKDYSNEMGKDLGLVVNAIAEDIKALQADGITHFDDPDIANYLGYTLSGSRYRSRWSAHNVPPGTTLEKWIKELLP